MAKERTCLVCGKKYEYCPHCGQHNPHETWRFLFCSENCNKIDNVIASYRSKEISASEAKGKLSVLSVPQLSGVTDYIRPFLEQINATVNAEVTALLKEEEVEPVVEKSKQLKILKNKRKIVNED